MIRIARVGAGPRAGEFLFTAGTVERLGRIYRRMQELPYQPGALEGLYADYMDSEVTIVAETIRLRNRLRPVNTATPRQTLEGFLHAVDSAFAIVMETDAALRQSPPGMSREEARRAEDRANNYIDRAVSVLDLSGVPRALRADVGVETVLLIKEVIDRVPLPPIDSVPDQRNVADLRAASGGAPVRWRVPNTEIEIVEILEGERAGEFLFSARTVRAADSFYDQVKDLPYRRADFALDTEWESAALSEGFYEFYSTTPGYLVPGTSALSAWIDGLPDALKDTVAGQTGWQWLGTLLVAVVVGLVGYLVFRLINRFAAGITGAGRHWLRILSPLAVVLLVQLALRFIDQDLNVTGNILAVVIGIAEGIIVALVAYAVYLLFKAAGETAIHWSELHEDALNANLTRVVARVSGFLVAAYVAVAGAQRIGADVVPLLAGLGVGGLAVALAAQKTLANFIGSLILLANKPVEEGDFCRYGNNQIGTVEKIGLHSTRIRTLERTVVTIPNADFSEMQLDNFAKRDERLFKTVLQLRYETTPDQMRYLLVQLRELLLGHPMVTPAPARARFVGFGAYSKDIEIFAYLRCRDQGDFLAIQEDVLLRIEDLVVKAGTGFAFPSQTAYLSRDGGIDDERGTAATAEVQSWRATRRLPFPDFEEEDSDRLEDILDYPPKGSPNASR
jgi:MscS family membrane protein